MEKKTAPRKKPMHGREKTVWPMVLAVGASVCGAVGKHGSGRGLARGSEPLWAKRLELPDPGARQNIAPLRNSARRDAKQVGKVFSSPASELDGLFSFHGW
jgi:hypothetical protein